jgi:hypothetical protein
MMLAKEWLAGLREKTSSPSGRLMAALICYGVLLAAALVALLPVRTSNERYILGFVLALFAILIIKTIAHTQIDSK